jgi:hypothetical protein
VQREVVDETTRVTQVGAVLNWFEELRRLAR